MQHLRNLLLGHLSAGAAPLAAPNAPAIGSVAPVGDGTTTKLAVTWAASAVDSAHGAASGYNLQYSVHAANSWTLVTGVASGVVLTGLTAATSYDVQVQGTNASPSSPGAWSASTTASTYTLAVAFGTWAPTGPVVHGGTWPGTGGGLMVFSSTAPPAGANGYFAYAPTAAPVPTSGLLGPVAAGTAGGTYGADGFGEYLSAPATAGTWYIFGIIQTSGGVTIGALVSAAITVT
jgi:hypothetical protein